MPVEGAVEGGRGESPFNHGSLAAPVPKGVIKNTAISHRHDYSQTGRERRRSAACLGSGAADAGPLRGLELLGKPECHKHGPGRTEPDLMC